MLGAIAGDIIGSVYEARPIKTTKFPLFHLRCRFTDDTITSRVYELLDEPLGDVTRKFTEEFGCT